MRTIATKLGSSSFYQSETVGSKVRNRTSDLTIVSQDPYTSVHGRLEVKSSLRRTCFTPDPIVVGVCRSRVHDACMSRGFFSFSRRDVNATISRRQVQRATLMFIGSRPVMGCRYLSWSLPLDCLSLIWCRRGGLSHLTPFQDSPCQIVTWVSR